MKDLRWETRSFLNLKISITFTFQIIHQKFICTKRWWVLCPLRYKTHRNGIGAIKKVHWKVEILVLEEMSSPISLDLGGKASHTGWPQKDGLWAGVGHLCSLSADAAGSQEVPHFQQHLWASSPGSHGCQPHPIHLPRAWCPQKGLLSAIHTSKGKVAGDT